MTIELICPSCEARYQIPSGSIGEKGRQVSCMNCGHGWHAYPPLMLGNGETGKTASRGLEWQGPGAVGKPAPPPPEPVPAGVEPTPPPQKDASAPRLAAGSGTEAQQPSAASRTEQLAEIRQMLAEVQSEDRAAAAIAPKNGPAAARTPLTATPAAVAAAATGPVIDPRNPPDADRAMDDAIHLEEEAYRERAARLSNKAQKTKSVDVRRLQRTHSKRVRRQKSAKEAGSGAFMTGLLLVAIVASVMIALYVLRPQIIQQLPGSEAALNEYAATIDGLRVSIAETYTGIREWVSSRLADKTA